MIRRKELTRVLYGVKRRKTCLRQVSERRKHLMVGLGIATNIVHGEENLSLEEDE